MRGEVYWNLHRNIWSVRRAGGKVCMHVTHCTIYEPDFVVQKAGHKRVLLERKKNVHAFVRGAYYASYTAEDPGGSMCGSYLRYARRNPATCVQVTYNPYRGAFFTEKLTGMKVTEAQWAVMSVVPALGQPKPEVWACFDGEKRKEALTQHLKDLNLLYNIQPMTEIGLADQSTIWKQIVATVLVLPMIGEGTIY